MTEKLYCGVCIKEGDINRLYPIKYKGEFVGEFACNHCVDVGASYTLKELLEIVEIKLTEFTTAYKVIQELINEQEK